MVVALTCTRLQVGKMLLWAVMLRCLEPIATIAACMSFKDPFVCPLHKQVLLVLTRYTPHHIADDS